MIFITSPAFTDIFAAKSETLIFSGISTSRTTGAVGFSNPCLPLAPPATTRGEVVFFRLLPDLSLATCNSARSSLSCARRSLLFRFFRGVAVSFIGAPSAICFACSASFNFFSVSSASLLAATRSASAFSTANRSASAFSASILSVSAFSAARRSSSTFLASRRNSSSFSAVFAASS